MCHSDIVKRIMVKFRTHVTTSGTDEVSSRPSAPVEAEVEAGVDDEVEAGVKAEVETEDTVVVRIGTKSS